MARDKVNLDIFWLRDESLEDSANLPDPEVLAREIMEELQAAPQKGRRGELASPAWASGRLRRWCPAMPCDIFP